MSLMTFEEAEEITAEIRGVKERTSDEHKAAVLLLLSASHGTNRKNLINLTEYREEFVNFVGDNLEASGIWVDDEVYTETGWEGKEGYIEFGQDILVAIGLAEVRFVE